MYNDATVSEEILGSSGGYSAFVLGCVTAIRNRAIIQRSPRGKAVDGLLCFLEERGEGGITDIAVLLVRKVHMCLTSNSKSRLPSVTQGNLWRNFHTPRTSDEIKGTWRSYISSVQAPLGEHELALQLLLDAILK